MSTSLSTYNHYDIFTIFFQMDYGRGVPRDNVSEKRKYNKIIIGPSLMPWTTLIKVFSPPKQQTVLCFFNSLGGPRASVSNFINGS